MKITTNNAKTANTPTSTTPGRVFILGVKSLPIVDARAKARLEEAARKPSNRRHYPEIS